MLKADSLRVRLLQNFIFFLYVSIISKFYSKNILLVKGEGEKNIIIP